MKVLIAQPEPIDKNSSYLKLAETYDLDISFVPFISINAVEVNAFKDQKVKILDHTAVILSSRNSVDHFFQMCSELKITIPPQMKYFCLSEPVANYLQKYIVPKRRNIFTGKTGFSDLSDKFKKFKGDRFLIVCSQNPKVEITDFFDLNGIDYTEVTFFEISSNDLSGLPIQDYDILAFFSPGDIKALFENFIDYNQNKTHIACFGTGTISAAKENGLSVKIQAPVPEARTLTDAIDLFLSNLKKVN